jgi:hypothetical protein
VQIFFDKRIAMSQKSKASPKPSPKNTLFNYFSKNNTPTSVEKKVEIVNKVETKKLDEKYSSKKLDFGEMIIYVSNIVFNWVNLNYRQKILYSRR